MSATRVILRGSGPAPEGYVGPCSCDPELGSHFHRYEAIVVPRRSGDYVAAATLKSGRPAAVLSCGCLDHPADAVFYTSARCDDRHVALSGPYAAHADALSALDAARGYQCDRCADRAEGYGD
jgi:hypothetical protein